jgi:hypothetical protein
MQERRGWLVITKGRGFAVGMVSKSLCLVPVDSENVIDCASAGGAFLLREAFKGSARNCPLLDYVECVWQE